MNLGQRLKEARQAAGMKQEDLAKHLGVSRQTISNWENERSTPDIGSALKMGKLYQTSLDTLLSGEEVIRHFEDLATKKRRFWQMMLEIGAILELLSVFIAELEFPGIAVVLMLSGNVLLLLSMIMHLRVFDHATSDIIGGGLGLSLHLGVILISLLGFWPAVDWMEVVLSLALLLSLLLIWASGVWTVDWNSTRLWLLVVLCVGAILLPIVRLTQMSMPSVKNSPFGGEYRVKEVLYPEDGQAYENAFLELWGSTNSISIAYDGTNLEQIGDFTYIEPGEEETGSNLWLLTPEEAPELEYRLVQEADGGLFLSLEENGQLRWKWQLMPNAYYGSIMARGPMGAWTSSRSFEWYPLEAPMPEPSYSQHGFIQGYAHITFYLPAQEGENLTMHEDYYHAGEVEHHTYTLTPDQKGRCKLKLTTRYDSHGDQCGIYRIPYDGGEFRFVLEYTP